MKSGDYLGIIQLDDGLEPMIGFSPAPHHLVTPPQLTFVTCFLVSLGCWPSFGHYDAFFEIGGKEFIVESVGDSGEGVRLTVSLSYVVHCFSHTPCSTGRRLLD